MEKQIETVIKALADQIERLESDIRIRDWQIEDLKSKLKAWENGSVEVK